MAELIPEPNIQATNIPTGGGAQVSFDFAAPSNTFANLSKTIAGAAQTMVNFNQLEENERKSKEAWQEQLKQIHGLTETGQLSDADYLKIQREANGKAQREGIIRAHENWSTMTDVSKERSKKRIDALGSYFQDQGGLTRMSNPDPDLATSFEQEQAAAYEGLGEMSLGRDSQGNDVYLGLEGLSPMEMVSFAQGQSALETATTLAVEELKEKRSIEASSIRFSGGVSSVIKDMLNEQSTLPGRAQTMLPDDVLNRMRLQSLRDLAGAAHSAGVPDLNALVLTATSDALTEYSEEAGLLGDDPREAVNKLINMLQEDTSLRDADGKPVLFASAGTENHLKLENLKNSVNTRLAKRLEDLDAEQPDKKDMVLAYGWKLLDALDQDGAEILGEEFKGMSSTDPKVREETYRLIKDYGRDNDYFEFNSVTTQFDDWFEKTEGRLNLEDDAVLELDNRLNGMVGIDSKPSADVLRAEVNQLFKEKRIDTSMRKALNDKIAKLSADALDVTTAKHEKDISWMAAYRNTTSLMMGQLNGFLNRNPAAPNVDRLRPAVFAVRAVNNVAQDLHKQAKIGGTYTPHPSLNPLLALSTSKDKDDAKVVAAIKAKIGASAYLGYEMVLSTPIDFGKGKLNEDNYLSRNAKAAEYAETLAVVYSAMQAVQVVQVDYTAEDFHKDLLGQLGLTDEAKEAK